MPQLQGSYFQDTLTLVCEHGSDGALGLIINKPLEIGIQDVADELDIPIPAALRAAHIPVYEGGPVAQDRGFVLHRKPLPDHHSLEVLDGVFLSGATSALGELLAQAQPEDFLLTLGYTGWAAGQLDAEMADNTWLNCDATSAIVFDRPPGARLQAAADQLGFDYRLLAGQAGHA